MTRSVYDDIMITIAIVLITLSINYLYNDQSTIVITIINHIKSLSLYKLIKRYYHYYNNDNNDNDIKYIGIYNYPIVNDVNDSYYDNTTTATTTTTTTTTTSTTSTTTTKTFNSNNKKQYETYINEQNNCTESYINNNMKDKEDFFKQLLMDIDYEDIITPYQAGNIFFYMKRNSLHDTSYWLYKSHNLDEESVLLIQPPDDMIIRGIWTSPDGKMVAYGLTSIDNDDDDDDKISMTVKVRDVDTCIDSDIDTIICNNINTFTLQWYQNHNGFFYVTKSPSDNVGVYYHSLGSSQNDDILTYDPNRSINSNDDSKEEEEAEEPLTFDIHVTSDNHYLVIEVFKREDAKFIQMVESSTKFGDITSCAGNSVRIIDLTNFDNTLKPGLCAHLITSYNDRFQFISNIEEDFWFRTNFNAINYRVVRLNLPTVISTVLTDDNRYKPIIISDSYIHNNIREWISETNGILQSASIASLTVLVLKYFKDCNNEILIYDLSQSLDTMPDTPVATLPQPSFGTISTPSCSFFSYSVFYKFSGFSHPCSIFRAQINRNCTGSIELGFDELYSVTVPGVDPYTLDTRKVDFPSYDGTSIPMFIFGTKKIFSEKCQHDAALYSHGAFGISVQPSFSLTILLYAYYCNAYFCIVNARGGSEKGSEWHQQAKKANKIKTTEDIVCATDFLIENEYSQKSMISLIGEGAGCYVLAGIMNKMPWKFRSCVFSQGLFEISTTNNIPNSTWADEFGSIDNIEEKNYIESSSPIKKVRNDDLLLVFPPMLLFVSENHKSISPFDSFRFIETLRSSILAMDGNLEQTDTVVKRPHLLYISDDKDLNDLYFLTFLYQQTTK